MDFTQVVKKSDVSDAVKQFTEQSRCQSDIGNRESFAAANATSDHATAKGTRAIEIF